METHKHASSLILTVKNESSTIQEFLQSLAQQSVFPNEVIITDASDNQKTAQKILNYQLPFPVRLITIDPLVNRSIGRNIAVDHSHFHFLIFTDAGCRLHKNFIKEMLEGFTFAEVVAGIAYSDAHTVFEKCVAPYVLIMPDKVDIHTYLPATRALGITKKLWNKLGGLDPSHEYGEDFAFSRRLSALHISIKVQEQAIVYWRPRKNLVSFIRMIYILASGDAANRTWRPKVATIYLRYVVFITLAIVGIMYSLCWVGFCMLLATYILFAILKSYRYVQHWKAYVYLPLLQFTSDFAVMTGTLQGVFTSRRVRPS